MMSEEHDPRAIRVLARALRSTSRMTRLRAVSMLASINCNERTGWLEAACADPDAAVAQTALGVLAWVANPPEPPWPQREDPRYDRVAVPPGDVCPSTTPSGQSRWQWEYVVEVWRDDGLLLGSFVAATCADDDEHAKRIALGQAILANSSGRGDAFDAATAAAFIVAKRRLPGHRRSQGRRSGPAGA